MRGSETAEGSMSAFSNWQHMLSLPLVELSKDRATARTDFFATHRGRADRQYNVHFNAAGAFQDELVRTQKGWRIQFRRLELYFADALAVSTGVPEQDSVAASYQRSSLDDVNRPAACARVATPSLRRISVT